RSTPRLVGLGEAHRRIALPSASETTIKVSRSSPHREEVAHCALERSPSLSPNKGVCHAILLATWDKDACPAGSGWPMLGVGWICPGSGSVSPVPRSSGSVAGGSQPLAGRHSPRLECVPVASQRQ